MFLEWDEMRVAMVHRWEVIPTTLLISNVCHSAANEGSQSRCCSKCWEAISLWQCMYALMTATVKFG